MNDPRYTVIIQWSEEDQAYVVSLPEWGPSCKTHGATYEEAARNAREVLEMLIESHDLKVGGSLPGPKLFNYPGADVVDLPPEAEAARDESVFLAHSEVKEATEGSGRCVGGKLN